MDVKWTWQREPLYDELCKRYKQIYHGRNIHNPTNHNYPPALKDVLYEIQNTRISNNNNDDNRRYLPVYITQIVVQNYELWIIGSTINMETVAIEVCDYQPSCFIFSPKYQLERGQDISEDDVAAQVSAILTNERERRHEERYGMARRKAKEPVIVFATKKEASGGR